MKKIMLVFGTRPEAIKMAPVIKALEKEKSIFEPIVCVTAQHRQMLDQVLELFAIKPDFDLNLMKAGQDLYDITSNVLLSLREILKKVQPNIVLVHGDTTTTLAASLASFYQQIPVGHVEAGLRTQNIYSPWPEEMNRQITGRIASYHFAPTQSNKDNLLKENVDENKIFITGNTVIDALQFIVKEIAGDAALQKELNKKISACGYDVNRLSQGRKMVLITGHRRENFGEGFLNICHAIKHLNGQYPQVDFIYPMHLNPNVRKPIKEVFGDDVPKNMFFIEPLDYLPFVYLMEKSTIILTDSGGIQEEAPSLGKPVLVMRDTTERPEAVKTGVVKLVGTSYENIVKNMSILLENETEYQKMSRAQNPYGDGQASQRILEILKNLERSKQ